MTTIDIIILVVIGVGVIQGLMKGFVKQLASIVGLIAGLLVARALFASVAEKLVEYYPPHISERDIYRSQTDSCNDGKHKQHCQYHTAKTCVFAHKITEAFHYSSSKHSGWQALANFSMVSAVMELAKDSQRVTEIILSFLIALISARAGSSLS